jgi:hypothetical protein
MRVDLSLPVWDSLKTWHFDTVKYLATSFAVNKSLSSVVMVLNPVI